jgi:hypothetical protein
VFIGINDGYADDGDYGNVRANRYEWQADLERGVMHGAQSVFFLAWVFVGGRCEARCFDFSEDV